MQEHNLVVVAMRTETNRVANPLYRSKAEDLFVEVERTVEISDLQSHSSETCRIRKPISFGTDAVLSMRRHNVAPTHYALPFSSSMSAPPASRFPLPASPLPANVLIVAKRRRTIRIAC